MAEAIKEGNLVYLAFDGWIENPGSDPQLFDTTDEDRAKEADLFDEKRTYGELPVIVGSGRLMEGLEQAILDAKVGEEKEVVIPPAQGMGERDPKLVELFPLREFRRREIEPQQGMEVQVRNRMGTVTAVTAGRVRVDFNNPLAGRTLRYKFKVLKKVKAAKAKVKAIIEMDYGSSDDFQIKVEKGKASIILPDTSKVDEAWFVNKFRVVSDLREHAGLKTILFLEEYTTPKEEAPTEETKETHVEKVLSLREAREGLEALTPREFEEKVAEIFRSYDYQVDQTPYNQDLGIDLLMKDKEGRRYAVQIKQHARGTIGRPDLQKLQGAMLNAKVKRATFVASSQFSEPAKQYAHENSIQLIDGDELAKMYLTAERKKSG